MTTVITDVTSPLEYITNTDEVDMLALDVSPDLAVGETVASAVCELVRMDTNADASDIGFPSPATILANVVSQQFDARLLSPVPHRWIWNVTLNTASIRSYRTLLRVTSHD